MWAQAPSSPFRSNPGSKLVAVLGPTNTGKTHRAIERMLEHPTGMLGLPLRLLAREVYDRVTREVGERAVALVTGEEKRLGQQPRYWVCTVEAMPVQHEVDFLAIDEIQLAAHPTRGHVFTDRLLHSRGRCETWFLGADTIRPLLRVLIPTATFESHARLSLLRGRGQAKLGTLPARSAVVAFSVPEVYGLAERLRHRRGGAAVVLGALSPRARNAQVALYEAREVDYLVATDAIGMGLNLGIRHVAFSGLRKFDGKEERRLAPAEMAQIAGRAGRHREDGSFGTLSPLEALSQGLSRAIEEHRFEPVRRLTWRNSDLCTASVAELIESLRLPPRRDVFAPLMQGVDLEALERLEHDPDVRRRSRGDAAVALLWQVCQIPDYRQWLPDLHAQLVKDIFLQLSEGGRVGDDWLSQQIAPLDDPSGDVDTLTARIASIRTWTYVSSHTAWVGDDAHWMQRTREIEDRLSDALHERLVERFVTRRRTTVEVSARGAAAPLADKSESTTPFQALERLRDRLFEAAPMAVSVERRIDDLIAAPHGHFHVDASGQVFAGDECLGLLVRGASLLRPELELSRTLELDGGQRLRLSRRLLAWSRDLVHEVVGSLSRDPPEPWSPAARGLLYQLEQGLGSLPRSAAKAQLAELTAADRRNLTALGVCLGHHSVYSRDALKPRQRLIRLALTQACEPVAAPLLPALSTRVSFVVPPGLPAHWLSRVGFSVVGQRAVRADLLERVSVELDALACTGPFQLPPSLAQWLGCSIEDASELSVRLGYQRDAQGAFHPPRRHRGRHRKARRASRARNRAAKPVKPN